MELQNKPIADNKFGTKSYIDATGLQALINKIAGLRKNILDTTTKDLEDLSEDLKKLIQANTDADAARETRLEAVENKVTTIEGDVTTIDGRVTTVEGDVATAKTDITNLKNDKADKAQLEDYVLKSTFNAFKDSVDADLAAILAALQNIVASADVEQAYTDAVAKAEAEDNTPEAGGDA